MLQASQAQPDSCVQLKGSLVPMTVMELFSDDIPKLETALMTIISQAPGFFEDTPVVIALERFNDQGTPIDFASISATCALLRIVPVAIRGGSQLQQIAAKKAGLAVIPPSKSRETTEKKATASAAPNNQTTSTDVQKVSLHSRPSPSTQSAVNNTSTLEEDRASSLEQEHTNTRMSEKPETSPNTERQAAVKKVETIENTPTKIIYQPVRSGQQVYAKGGDLIVLAAVSPGAEILADGNIHVYGPLRGRALAGVQGDTKARIFCHSLEAELVSIAGQYKISEDLQKSGWKSSSQVYLVDDKLTITPLQP